MGDFKFNRDVGYTLFKRNTGTRNFKKPSDKFYRGGTRITSGTHIIKSSYGQCRNIFFFDIDFMQFLRNIDAYRKGSHCIDSCLHPSASVMPSVFTPIAPAIRMYFEAAGDSALYSMTYGNSKALDRRTST